MALEWIQDAALSDPAACAALQLNASHNGAPAVTHPLSAPHIVLSASAQGAWQLTADVPVSGALPIPVAHGERCVGVLRASARDGFSDEETIPVDLAVRTVLLNEILPNPDPDASLPNDREWIELINIGNASVDIAGWMISEMTNSGSEVFHTIKAIGEPAAPTDLVPIIGNTLLPPGGTVVLAFAGNQAFLNNAGDTVRLYESQQTPIDAVAYTQSDAPQGKSIARFPDGIGGWWDPMPTPGLPNQPSPTDTPLAKRAVVVPSEEDPPILKAAPEVAGEHPAAQKEESTTSTSTSAVSSPDLTAPEESGESYENSAASSTPSTLTAREEPRSASTTPEASQEAPPDQPPAFTPQQNGSDNTQTTLPQEPTPPPPSLPPPSEPPAPLAPSGAQASAHTPPRSASQENTQEQDASLQQGGDAGERPEATNAQTGGPPSQTAENGASKEPTEAPPEADAAGGIALEL
ncbi:MAG: hypothetical protein KatS3mg099_092 [Candidatus Parcubacteria bacterium]|nr:MAG: hypothetical protein KatS3mg099_092 [Candidatus Parcubacteria bacterium]